MPIVIWGMIDRINRFQIGPNINLLNNNLFILIMINFFPKSAKKHVHLLLLFVFLILQSSNAQFRVTGIVSKKDLNTPLEFVTVGLFQNNKLLQTSIADSLGRFSFSNVTPETYRIHVSFIGYKTLDSTIDIRKNISLNILLLADKTQLKEITVLAKKPLIERKVDRLVFNLENTINTTGLNTIELLAKAPLLQVKNEGISMFGRSDVVIMINERIIHLTGPALDEFLKSIPVETITRIEIITNPSAKYEAAGNSGMVNIVTKRTRQPGYSGTANLSLSQSSSFSIRPSVTLNYNTKRIQFFGTISTGFGSNPSFYTNQIKYPTYTWDSYASDKEFSNVLQTSFGFEIPVTPKTSVGASYNRMHSEPDKNTERTTNIIDGLTEKIDSIIYIPSKEKKLFVNQSINIHFTHLFDSTNKKITIDADWYQNKYDLQTDISKTSYFSDGQLIPNSTFMNTSYNNHDASVYSINSILDIPLKEMKISVGSKASFFKNANDVQLYNLINNTWQLDSANSNSFKYNENIQALFLNINWPYKKFEFQAGLRGEFTQTKGFSSTLVQTNTNSYFDLFPTFYLTYQANKKNVFSFSYGRRLKRPSFAALNPFRVYREYYNYIEGNPYLKPYFSNNFEVTHTYKNFITSTLQFSKEKNAIYYLTLPEAGSNLIKTQPSNSITTIFINYDCNILYPRLKWLESSNEFSVFYTDVNSKLAATGDHVFGWGGDLKSINTFYFNKKRNFTGELDIIYEFPGISSLSHNESRFYTDVSFRYLLNKKIQFGLGFRDIFKSKTLKWSQTVAGILNSGSVNNGTRRIAVTARYNFGNTKLKKGSAHSQLGGDSGRVN